MVTLDGVAKVLNGVNLTVHRGDLLGLVGETGCGKSVTAMSIPQLVPQPPARYTAATSASWAKLSWASRKRNCAACAPSISALSFRTR